MLLSPGAGHPDGVGAPQPRVAGLHERPRHDLQQPHARDRGHPREGDLHRQALEIRRQLVEQAPTNNFFRRNLARTYQNMGSDSKDVGRLDEALQYFQEGRRLLEQVAIEQPAVTVLGQILNHLGEAMAARGQRDEARTLLQRSRAIFEKLHHASPGDSSFAAGVRDAKTALAKVERDAKAAQPTPRADARTPKVAGRSSIRRTRLHSARRFPTGKPGCSTIRTRSGKSLNWEKTSPS